MSGPNLLTVIMTSPTPASRNWLSRWSITVSSPTGISALGRTVEYGARRVPRPPAWITAFSSAIHITPPNERRPYRDALRRFSIAQRPRDVSDRVDPGGGGPPGPPAVEQQSKS